MNVNPITAFSLRSLSILCALLVFAISLKAQHNIALAPISPSDFSKMSSGEKSSLIHQWINESRQFQVPMLIEEKAKAYYQANHIEDRVYQKYKVLLQTVTNERLALPNRINACHFIIENYDPSLFPVDLVKDILTELNTQSK